MGTALPRAITLDSVRRTGRSRSLADSLHSACLTRSIAWLRNGPRAVLEDPQTPAGREFRRTREFVRLYRSVGPRRFEAQVARYLDRAEERTSEEQDLVLALYGRVQTSDVWRRMQPRDRMILRVICGRALRHGPRVPVPSRKVADALRAEFPGHQVGKSGVQVSLDRLHHLGVIELQRGRPGTNGYGQFSVADLTPFLAPVASGADLEALREALVLNEAAHAALAPQAGRETAAGGVQPTQAA